MLSANQTVPDSKVKFQKQPKQHRHPIPRCELTQKPIRNTGEKLRAASGFDPSPVRVGQRRCDWADQDRSNLSGNAAGVPLVAARPALRSGTVQTLEAPGETRGLLF